MFVRHQPLSQSRQAMITNAVAEFVVDGLHLISIIDQSEFHKLLNVLKPAYSPACAKTLKDNITKMYNVEAASLLDDASKTEQASITHEHHWVTSPKRQLLAASLTVNGNFMPKCWVPHKLRITHWWKHPVSFDDHMYFISDVPHLLKMSRNCFPKPNAQ